MNLAAKYGVICNRRIISYISRLLTRTPRPLHQKQNSRRVSISHITTVTRDVYRWGGNYTRRQAYKRTLGNLALNKDHLSHRFPDEIPQHRTFPNCLTLLTWRIILHPPGHILLYKFELP